MIVKSSFPLPDLGEMAVKACYSSFRKHSVEIHSLKEEHLADSRKFLDLNKWTLTLHDLSGQDVATLHN